VSSWFQNAGGYLSFHRNEVLVTVALVLAVELVVRLGGYMTRRKHVRRLDGGDRP
jgi:hypothetical protein